MSTWKEKIKLNNEEIMDIVLCILGAVLALIAGIITKNPVWIICTLLWSMIAIMEYDSYKMEKANDALIGIQEECIEIQEDIINALISETAVEVEINKIKIPEHYAQPNQKKMRKKFEYYIKNHKFESQIIIDSAYNLLDGYTSYLIAKNYNQPTVIAKIKR